MGRKVLRIRHEKRGDGETMAKEFVQWPEGCDPFTYFVEAEDTRKHDGPDGFSGITLKIEADGTRCLDFALTMDDASVTLNVISRDEFKRLLKFLHEVEEWLDQADAEYQKAPVTQRFREVS
jgi:hypothetical protein